ncbi:MAG: glycosyltransferase family protein [Bacteroidota bacterium]|nr:glycosyltransferase family protein [Bacteroidota bacterium]
MKILYAIQGTGNGHITRAMELIPEIKERVSQLDIAISGTESELKLNHPVKYKLKGLQYFFGKRGGIHFSKTLVNNNLFHFYKEISEFPITDYDMLINDFEPVTAWSAQMKGVYSVGISNQIAVLDHHVPRPNSADVLGKFILKNFAPTTMKYGIHYKSYNERIYKPVIRREIRQMEPENGKFQIVYLPSWDDSVLKNIFSKFKKTDWHIFSKRAQKVSFFGNVAIYPVDNELFLEKLEKCEGVVTNSGFGTTSEALYLNKKLLVFPMKGQLEQQCNAYCLRQMGVSVIDNFGRKSLRIIQDWLDSAHYINLYYPKNNSRIIRQVFEDYFEYNRAMVNINEREILTTD